MLDSVFSETLRLLLRNVPRSHAAVFADWEGEMVDQAVNESAYSHDEARLRAAHWGVVYFLIRQKLGPLTRSPAEEVILHFSREIVLVHAIDLHYFVTLSIAPDGPLARATAELAVASHLIREQI